MSSENWSKLSKLGPEYYKLTLDNVTEKYQTRKNFLHLCFNDNDENLIGIDSKGSVYLFEYFSTGWSFVCLGTIGQSTFVSYSPIAKCEILVGQTTTDVKILKLSHESLTQFCTLKGHKISPTCITYYNNYCLTCSLKEAVIWNLQTGDKIHQLRLDTSHLKKSIISSNGLIAVLYKNNTIQLWKFNDFNNDKKIILNDYNMTNAKDLIFVENGRCMIVCGGGGGGVGKKNILIFETKTWTVTMAIELAGITSSPRRIQLLEPTLDSGLKKILIILFDNGNLKLLDLSTNKFIPIIDKIFDGIRKFCLSPQGQWIAAIQFDGSITINAINQIIKITKKNNKSVENIKSSSSSHRVDEHLECIRQQVNEQLTKNRLLPILKEFKEYPERHRPRIWKSLLNLPDNRKACLELTDKIADDMKPEILKDLNLTDKSKGTILSLTVEKLVCLCPLLSQASFIPELIFPYLIVFKNDSLAAFEMSLTIIMNFCKNWFEYHPLPPINILGIIENILMEVDPELLGYYCQINVTSSEYAWPLLRTTLSEVLTANEWLILWDHILSYGKPSFLLFSIVAYEICLKNIIFRLLKNKQDAQHFFRTPGQVGVYDIIKIAQKLDANVSKRNHPSRYLLDEFEFLPENGPYPPFLMNEFPKFLISDQENISKLQKLQAEEVLVKQKNLEAKKRAEKKMINDEIERFSKEIHNQRLKELQKCYNEQLKLTKLSLENERDEYQRITLTENIEQHKTANKNDKKKTKKSFQELQKNVDKLEDEVQSFLGSLKTSRK
ncbi:hypothetical protein HCN44_011111 [Aphidius gifuensis]|uniref:Rab-GAP TBC domain-containing protein n=1 Tax=Aphidius gifuensis TaxID=684658 RepID=A0A835CS03_APHGI|nr:TBC1 domain family member 31 [Aphidius gifuensis]KAF7993842.1 hypothetical protein HCN44_011111 [Aphidius gifuensis]